MSEKLSIIITELDLNFNNLPNINDAIIYYVSPNVKRNIKKSESLYLIKDYGIGVAAARNLAIKKCNGDYILFWGNDIDNSGFQDNIDKIINEIIYDDLAGAAFLLKEAGNKTYYEKCMNIRWFRRFIPGETNVIGTPSIWKASVLKKYMLNEKCGYSDDTDLAERIFVDGHKIAYSSIRLGEYGQSDYKKIKYRFIMYGKGDCQIFNKHKKEWSFIRKVKSIFHPLICEFIPNIFYMPFYLMIVFFRYSGWIKESKK